MAAARNLYLAFRLMVVSVDLSARFLGDVISAITVLYETLFVRDLRFARL